MRSSPAAGGSPALPEVPGDLGRLSVLKLRLHEPGKTHMLPVSSFRAASLIVSCWTADLSWMEFALHCTPGTAVQVWVAHWTSAAWLHAQHGNT